eukprot:7785998-Ditylum_brightwellii.AAC.1
MVCEAESLLRDLVLCIQDYPGWALRYRSSCRDCDESRIGGALRESCRDCGESRMGVLVGITVRLTYACYPR